MIRHINHIGIAVPSLADQIPFYRDVLGLAFLGEETVEEQKVRVAMFQCGEVKIELLEPTAADSPIAVFLEKKGTGIHHVAYAVEDIDATLVSLKEQGVKLIDEEARTGIRQSRVAFLHPAATGAVLTEIVQPAEDH